MFETLSAPTAQVALSEDAPLALFAILFLKKYKKVYKRIMII